jgi:hypothetical protein
MIMVVGWSEEIGEESAVAGSCRLATDMYSTAPQSRPLLSPYSTSVVGRSTPDLRRYSYSGCSAPVTDTGPLRWHNSQRRVFHPCRA